MLQEPENLLASQDMISATKNFLTFFIYAILAALCVGLIAAAATYLVRPFLGKLSQFWTVRRWADERLKKARRAKTRLPDWLSQVLVESPHRDFIKSSVEKPAVNTESDDARDRALASFPDARFWSTALPDELFMHSLQVVAKTVVARPSDHPELFEILTADAPPDARGAAYGFALLSMRDPAEAGRLADFARPDNRAAAGFASTENLVAASVERALDQLQLSLIKKRIWMSRIFCVVAGVALASVAVTTLKSPNPAVFYAIGVAGGVVALVIDDTVAWVFGRGAK
jgi:hypothetical protein